MTRLTCLLLVTLWACTEPPPAGTDNIATTTATTTATTPTTDTGTPPVTVPWEALDADLVLRLQAGLEAAHAEQGFPGAALALAKPATRQRWVGTIGLANLDGDVPWLLQTPYPIGSVTKTFTSVLVLQLAEEGVLSLDDGLDAWLTTAWAGQGLTLRHLVQHTSGIVSYNWVGNFDDSAQYTPQELVDWAAQEGPALDFAPGTQWAYSNTNYVLLGLLIEEATGGTYEAALNERLLLPLALHDTFLATDNPDDVVRGYLGDPLTDVTEDGQPTVGWAAGGIISTPADLVAWGAALFGGDVLSQASLDEMTTPLPIDGVDYGLGLFGNNDDEFGPFWGHTGGTGGHLTYLFSLERNDAVVVAMVNSFEADLDKLAEAAWIPVLGL